MNATTKKFRSTGHRCVRARAHIASALLILVMAVSSLAAEKGVAVRRADTTGTVALGDPRYIEQAGLVLLENAVKITRTAMVAAAVASLPSPVNPVCGVNSVWLDTFTGSP